MKDLFPKLQSQQGFTEAKDLGCTVGETSTTFLNGGGPCPDKTKTPQLTRALEYIHQGNVGLVTLNIGADDLLPDIKYSSEQKTCQIDQSSFTTHLQTLKDNLPKILQPLHDALNGSGMLLLLNYYNAFQNICPETTQDVRQLNDDLATAIQPYGGLVNIFKVFSGDSSFPNQKLCTYTGMCKPTISTITDIHPTAEGYKVMADAILYTTNTVSWAGYVASSDGNHVYTEATMSFTVPTITATQVKDTYVAIWAGVGGGGSTSPQEQVRAGVIAEVDSQGNQTDRAWWEVIGDGQPGTEQPMQLDVKPSDQIWVYVGSGNSDHNNGYDGFLVEDLTQGTSDTHYTYDANTFSDSATAECIVERPVFLDGFGLLPNFGTITVKSCGAYTNGQAQYAMTPISNFAPDQLNMTDKHNTLLARTSPLSNGADFDVTWQNMGKAI